MPKKTNGHRKPQNGPWTAHETIDSSLQRLQQERIERRQKRFLSYTIRKQELEDFCLSGQGKTADHFCPSFFKPRQLWDHSLMSVSATALSRTKHFFLNMLDFKKI